MDPIAGDFAHLTGDCIGVDWGVSNQDRANGPACSKARELLLCSTVNDAVQKEMSDVPSLLSHAENS